MSGEGIYLIQEDGGLLELTEQPYESEDLLQQLLERYPSLLAGRQMNPAEPRRWVLVTREAGMPSRLGGSAQWSADHVFLDQAAIPTIVEVKRSSDTRIRREVVGQMLDYAANAVVYWPVEAIQAAFERTCSTQGVDGTQAIQELSGPEQPVEAFWSKVKINLQAGRIRMVFVADRIPPELQRIVEFLNEQMDPAEVLAVELRQFVGAGVRTMAPRVLGQTAAAERNKGPGQPTASFVERMAEATSEVHEAAQLLEQWSASAGITSKDGPGARTYFAGRLNVLNLNPNYATVQFNIEAIRQAGHETEAGAIHDQLSRIAGRRLPPQFPTLACAVLIAHWDELLEEILPAYLGARLRATAGVDARPQP
jgi:hypothetical protein